MKHKKYSYKDIEDTLITKPSLTFKILRLILLLIGVLSILSWMFVDFNLGNFKLAWLSVVVGLIIAYFFGLLLEKLLPEIAIMEAKKKSDIGVMAAMIFFSLTPVALQYVNKEFLNSNVRCKSYLVISKEATSIGRHGGFNFIVSIDHQRKSIDCNKDLVDKITVGKNIELCIANGGLGFDYIKEIKTE